MVTHMAKDIVVSEATVRGWIRKYKEHGCIQSMGAKGCCYDNSCAKSFFPSLKKDMLYGRKVKTTVFPLILSITSIGILSNSFN